jgi:hypothetical protein
VNGTNDAPTLIVESTKTVAEDGTTSITFEAGDVDGTVVTTATATVMVAVEVDIAPSLSDIT